MKKLSLLLLVSMAFLVASCEKSRVYNRLEGFWEIYSFVEDGSDLIGPFLSSATFDFEEVQRGSGFYTWQVFWKNGDIDTMFGSYEYDPDGNFLLLSIDNENNFYPTGFYELKMDVSRKRLDIYGNIGGFDVDIRAE